MNIKDLRIRMQSLNPKDFSFWCDQLLSEVGELPSLISLIESIISNNEELEYMARESFLHNLGFIRLNVLGWDRAEYMLKIHVWNLNSLPLNELNLTVHNHMCDFTSKVVSGRLNFSIYAESESGLVMKKYYNPLSKDKYIFDYVGEKSLHEQLNITLMAGSQYSLSHEVLHYTSVSSGTFTSTVCLQSPVRQMHTFIYSQEKLLNTLPKSKRFDKKSLKLFLREYLTKL